MLKPVCNWPATTIAARPASKLELVHLRALVFLGIIAAALFVLWVLDPERRGDLYLYWPLTIAFVVRILLSFYEWFLYWRIADPPRPSGRCRPTVDVLTTWCPGEPREMVARTLTGMVAMRYPHRNFLCDEGNDPVLRELCARLGVVHVTRTDKRGAKAGNINNALRQTRGEVVVILDPDHEPAPEFLDRVVDFFADPEVGYVQVVQAYYNQGDSFVARAAAEQTYHFYGPMMIGMQGCRTVQAIGANCAFRRAALDSIGGHAAGLAEDMHTALRLQAEGWKPVYLPELLTRGLVPATLGAYSKQQIKWACGTFDILIETYFGVVRRLSWLQRLHYPVCGLFYLGGFVTALNLLVPIVCLLVGGIAWRATTLEFLLAYVPLFAATFLVRQFVQRWLIERSEHGIQLAGGLLKTASWWIFCVGVVCSLCRVKIPYIPTPKEEGASNAGWISVPNIVVIVACLAATTIGLAWDWSPYGWLMASFAIANTIVLSVVVLAAEQSRLLALRTALLKSRLARLAARGLAQAATLAKATFLSTLGVVRERNSVSILFAAVLLTTAFSMQMTSIPLLGDRFPPTDKSRQEGGFHLGIYLPSADRGLLDRRLPEMEAALGRSFGIVSLYQAWGSASLESFPESLLRQIWKRGGIPMITWEPWSRDFPWAEVDADLRADRRVLAAILDGRFDDYITAYAGKLRDLGGVVFMRFAHEMDNPAYPWSPRGGNSAQEFVAAWRHVVGLFNRAGATKVAWVWSPWHPDAIERYYPGDDYVDWIGITLLNYGLAASDGRWHSFEPLYAAYRHRLLPLNKPIMLAEFGTTPYGGQQIPWLADALHAIERRYPEIKSTVFFHSNRDANWPTSWRPRMGRHAVDWTFIDAGHDIAAVRRALSAPRFDATSSGPSRALVVPAGEPRGADDRPSHVRGGGGSFELMVDGRPFYIRGVAYGLGQDWRDGGDPASRRAVEDDFAAMREMGANTVRRYGVSWYDHNILNAAERHGLKVLFGFWLAPDIDYRTNDAMLQHYEETIVDAVRRHRDHPAVLAWGLGNETWGLLKHHFAEPYLTEVRHAYLAFLQRMERRLRKLDPRRPVFTAAEHSSQLAGELADLHRAIPGLDFIAVNSYYESRISQLDAIARAYNPSRPYLVSEFGPDGYWDSELTRRDVRGGLIEGSTRTKADRYATQWAHHVEAKAGANIGGVAYAWRDRLEGSATWFGITGWAGHRKAAYFALQRAWTGTDSEPTLPAITALYGEDRAFAPGEEVTFEAEIVPGEAKIGRATWELRHEITFRHAGEITPLGVGATARIVIDDGSEPTSQTGIRRSRARVKIPASPGRYRLHVGVTDEAGTADTASLPVHVAPAATPSHQKVR